MPPVDTEVIERDPVTPVVPPKDSGKEDNVTITRAEMDALRRERDEARESERYWATAARSGSRAAEPAAEADEVDASGFLDEEAAEADDDTPEKLVNDLASQGAKALGSRGYVKAADVKKMAAEIAIKVSREMIQNQVQRSSSDTAIMSAYPELKDQTSELFRATAKIYQEAVAMDPSARKTPAALFLAAKAAKASLKPAPTRRDEDENDRPERESERRQRASSQDGRTRGRGEVVDDDMLGSEARDVIKAMGITEAEYKASQKETGTQRRRR